MRPFALTVIMICVLVMLITACGGNAADQRTQVVVDYINALVNKDSAKLSALSCSTWEQNAQLEYDSLQAVNTRLEGLICSVIGTDGSTAQVNCLGKILATYNNEDQEIDLSVRNYQVIQQNGEYLVCGYQ
jgi:hypothetical protein